jgi:hypothetical protein
VMSPVFPVLVVLGGIVAQGAKRWP